MREHSRNLYQGAGKKKYGRASSRSVPRHREPPDRPSQTWRLDVDSETWVLAKQCRIALGSHDWLEVGVKRPVKKGSKEKCREGQVMRI